LRIVPIFPAKVDRPDSAQPIDGTGSALSVGSTARTGDDALNFTAGSVQPSVKVGVNRPSWAHLDLVTNPTVTFSASSQQSYDLRVGFAVTSGTGHLAFDAIAVELT